MCVDLQRKVKEILKNYPEIERGMMDYASHRELGSALSIFTAPLMLLFIEGKEVLRESKYVDIEKMERGLERYYRMLF